MKFLAITIPRKIMKRGSVFLALLIIFGSGIKLYSLMQRRLYAIAPGVTLGGELIGGMYPEELKKLLSQDQSRWSVPSVNARWQEGKVVSAMAGVELDLDATVSLALEAESGQAIMPVLKSVAAAVDKDHYQAIYELPNAGGRAALTINVDWGEEFIPAMLGILKKNKARATFFVTGAWAEKNPELLREISRSGQEIGNHGMSHLHPAQLDEAGVRKLILDCQKVIERIIGKPPSKLYAPAYGEVNARIVNAAAQIGYRTVMWSADTIDWQKPAPAVMVERVQKKIRPGGIILMHPTENTVAALPGIIEVLAKRQLQPVSVGELVRAKASP